MLLSIRSYLLASCSLNVIPTGCAPSGCASRGRIVPSRRPLALASSPGAFAMARATISSSQADPVLFLITKRTREPDCNRVFQDTINCIQEPGMADDLQKVLSLQ